MGRTPLLSLMLYLVTFDPGTQPYELIMKAGLFETAREIIGEGYAIEIRGMPTGLEGFSKPS